MDLKTGQVFYTKNSLIFITNVDFSYIYYDFYNRDEFYYPPNNRRKLLDFELLKELSNIEVKECINSFKDKINKKSLKEDTFYFNKRPTPGKIIKKEEY
jgi:hypothetical protein